MAAAFDPSLLQLSRVDCELGQRGRQFARSNLRLLVGNAAHSQFGDRLGISGVRDPFFAYRFLFNNPGQY